MPEGWDENPNRLQQKNLDARWAQKNGLNHFGYKNNICIDVEHEFIRRHAVTPANIHDSQMLPMLLDPENSDNYVWADSAYAGERFEDLLILGGGCKVAFTKKTGAITRLETQPKSVSELNQQSELVLNMFLAA